MSFVVEREGGGGGFEISCHIHLTTGWSCNIKLCLLFTCIHIHLKMGHFFLSSYMAKCLLAAVVLLKPLIC